MPPPTSASYQNGPLNDARSLKRQTVTISPSGSSFSLPQNGGFSGTVTYDANDAPSGATLTLTNSGLHNRLGVPTSPSGTPVLYFDAAVSAASEVSFASGSSLMKLKSASLRDGNTYQIYAYAAGQRVESYAAQHPKNETLTFRTPLSGVVINSGAPLSVEVVLAGTHSPFPSPSHSAADWDSFGFDLQRTGYNPLESKVGTKNVSTLQMVWTFGVGSNMVHEPVYAAGVMVHGHARNMLYAGSAYGSAMVAINTSTGGVMWKKAVPHAIFSCAPSRTLRFSIGETPAIDRKKNLLYFADGRNQVHAVDLGTGKEASGWPLTVADYKPDHNFMHGGLTYNPSNGLLYAVTGSTCDISPWYGRIVAINTSGPSLVGTFYTMSGGPSRGASGGGIWGPGGASIDPSTGNVFVATGNADTTKGALQNAPYAEQVIELPPRLRTIIANNYPTNIPSIYGDDDFDFGATPLLFQPGDCPPLLAAINKSGVFELYDRDSINYGPIQYIAMSAPTDRGQFIGVPAFDPITGYVYVGLPTTEGIYRPGLAAFKMQSDCTLNPTPVWNADFGPDGDPSSTSRRSPISIANGVVYVSNFTGNTEYAFDAATGAQLWQTALSWWGNEGTVIANGMVFVSSDDGVITAWALPDEAKKMRKHIVKASQPMPVHHSAPPAHWGPFK